MEFGVLGPLEVRSGAGDDARRVDIRRGISRTLLTLLLMHRGETVSAGAIADVLWGDEQPRNPSNALQIQVSYLRKQLGAHASVQPIATRPGGYSLDVEPERVDAHRFERAIRLAARSAPSGHDELVDSLAGVDGALALWRGDAFADVAGEAFAIGESARLDELRLVGVELRHDLMLALGRHHELVGELTVLVRDHPLRERLHEQLVLALYRSGRQADALRAYEHTRARLVDELGIDPGPALRDLERRILAQDPTLSWTPPAGSAPSPVTAAAAAAEEDPTRPPVRPTAGIPLPFTRLVGRAIELARIVQLLERSRIVTLTGPPGAGKSRLALETAANRSAASDVWFVDLGAVADPEHVAPTVAAALGIAVVPGEDPVATVAAALGGRDGVLVLDTCEHLVGAAAALVGGILRQARDVRILATSRRPLGIIGEVAWPVPPLALAPPNADSADAAAGYPAVELFVERAAAVRPEFELNDANAADVVAICLALDGLPLAIELAAARADVLAPHAIRTRLMRRFELLVDGSSDVAPRQRTLRAAIDWSAELLDEEQRIFFARLGVVAGTFDLEAAAALTDVEPDEALSMVTALVRQSLVSVVGDDRYRLLDTLRAYALQILESLDADDSRQRHAEYHVELAERAERGIQGRDQLAWLARLRSDVPDHRAALEWLVSTGDGVRAARLAGALGWFWTLDGMLAEASTRLEQVLSFDGLPPAVRGKAAWTLALLAASLGELDRARRLASEAVELGKASGDPVVTGCGLNALSVTQWAVGELEDSVESRRAAAAAFTEADHEWGRALCGVLGARTAIDVGDADAASMVREGLAAARATGDLHLVGIGLEQATRLALREDRIADAMRFACEAVEVQERIGYTEGIIAALHLLAQASQRDARTDAAAGHHRRALQLGLSIGHVAAMCEAIEGLAHVADARGDRVSARSLLAEATRHRAVRSLRRREDDEQWIAHVRQEVDDLADVQRQSAESLEDLARRILSTVH